MQVTVSIIRPDGTLAEPTEPELQIIAERYAIALLQLSLPGSKVRLTQKD